MLAQQLEYLADRRLAQAQRGGQIRRAEHTVRTPGHMGQQQRPVIDYLADTQHPRLRITSLAYSTALVLYESSRFFVPAGLLQHPHLRIPSALQKQIAMRAALQYPAIVQHDDLIGIHDGG